MLSSQSTLAKDPSLLPLCGVGTAAPSGFPVAQAGDDAADFGALFADLNPTEPPEAATTPDLGVCCLPVLGLAFAPPPVTSALEPGLTAGAAAGSAGANEADEQPGEGNLLWSGRSDVRPDGAGRGGENNGRVFGSAIKPGLSELSAGPGPAGTASERATQTPRYAGLPAAALEHRQAAVLPPGITRLQALHAEASTSPTLPGQGAAEVGPDGLPQILEITFAGNGSQVPFRGAVLTKPDHPGDAARAALERNGFAADEPASLRSDRAFALEEKIAGRRDGVSPAVEGPANSRKKSFLATEEEAVARQGRSLGTDGAKSAHAMPATSLQPPPTHPNSHYTVMSVASAGSMLSEAAPLAEVADTFSTAHEAVEVVLHAVEHVASREQKSVQLKFSVAGEELAVRVEMRADEVRTTFRTDSAELRAALEHEWQQVAGASTAADRSARVSPAVFAAAGQSALNAFAGDTSSRDRRAGTPRDEFELPVAGIRGRSVAAAVHDIPLPVTAAPTRSGGAHRLHTLA